MVKRIFSLGICFLCGMQFSALSQTSKVLEWRLPPPQQDPRVYRPEPILFVHGINANDSGWQNAIDALHTSFGAYQAPNTLPIDTSAQRATQYAFLHTFNYGDRPGVSTRDRQSFDTIRWNAWAADRDGWPLPNPYKGTTQNAPADGRQTLDERIAAIRVAYRASAGADSPNVILVAHSLGGLLSHYYLLNKPTDHGVRRLVTIATPHLGSHVANWLSWYNNANPLSKMWDNCRAEPALRLFLMNYPDTAGFFAHGRRGAVWDLRMVDNRSTTSAHQHGSNPLMDFFQAHSAPVSEYVFSVYHKPLAGGIGALSVAINQNPASAESERSAALQSAN
ncbi:MAG TPA: alpha/beta fold hydrolase [Verrucomicrobiae bacterium]|nr:alpha/beta fold hydrolase [Verrucomicrobiae bacterium]